MDMEGQNKATSPIYEQDTQKIKWEGWTPSSQAADIDAFWHNLTLKTPKAESDDQLDSMCFPLEEVESCVKDKSSISFLPTAEAEVPGIADIHEVAEEKETGHANESGSGETEHEKEPEPSTSTQVSEPQPGSSRSLLNSNHDNEEREREVEPIDDENHDTSGEPKPFSCTLCSAKFPRKLLLSAHVEKRHGVKYVFTERGKKVKLVRMPEIVKKGDKLDPFVELLLKKNADVNQKKDSNALLVHPVDPNSSFTGVAEELDPQEVFKNILSDDANCGILVDNLDTSAYIEACNKGEIPFVAFGSVLTQNHFLLRILQLNDQKQILVPATPKDIKNPKGIFAVFNRAETKSSSTSKDFEQEETEQMETENDEGENVNPAATDEASEAAKAGGNGEQEEVADFSNLCVVAYADVVLNKELKQFQVTINSPVKGDVINSEFIKFDDFRDTVLLCKPKRLRCLSQLYPNEGEATAPETSDNSSNSHRPKRKYTRRNYGKENQAKALANAIAASEEGGVQVTVGEGESKFQVLLQTEGSAEKIRKSRKTDDDDDDEEKDATYSPSKERKEMVRAPKKRRIRARFNNPAKRRLDFDECDEEHESNQNEEDKQNVDPMGGDSDGQEGSKDGFDGKSSPKTKSGTSIQVKKECSSQNSQDSSEKEGRTQNKRGRGRPPKLIAAF